MKPAAEIGVEGVVCGHIQHGNGELESLRRSQAAAATPAPPSSLEDAA